MSIRSLIIVSGLLALTAAPLTAHADGSDRAADACIQSFVDAYLPGVRQVKVRTVSPVSGPLGVYTKRYTIELSAHLVRSGAELVTAQCVASATGRVISLDSPTVDAPAVSSSVTRLK